jgi:hypothetical protein
MKNHGEVEKQKGNLAIRLSLRFDLPKQSGLQSPPGMWRSAECYPGHLSNIETTHVALPDWSIRVSSLGHA